MGLSLILLFVKQIIICFIDGFCVGRNQWESFLKYQLRIIVQRRFFQPTVTNCFVLDRTQRWEFEENGDCSYNKFLNSYIYSGNVSTCPICI